MDSLLLVVFLSGMCMLSALGLSVFILAASIQSSRISRMEKANNMHASMQPLTTDSLTPNFTDSIS